MIITPREKLSTILFNAEYYWMNHVLENQEGFHYEFWQWLNTNFAITRNNELDEVFFNDHKLMAIFFLRFSS